MAIAVVNSQHITERGSAMTKQIKIRVVRREPIDAERLAEALVELAFHLTKPKDQAPTKTSKENK